MSPIEKLSKLLSSRILKHINDAVISTNNQGIITSMNSMAETLTGWTEEAAQGKALESIFRPANEKIHQQIIEWASNIPQKKVNIGKNKIITLVSKDGTKIPIQYNGILIEDNNDNILGHLLIFRDVSRQKTAKDRLDRAMAAGNLAWWEMELPSGKIDFNERKAKMLGYSPESFKHYTDFTDLLHPKDHEKAMKAMQDHLEGNAPSYKVEYRIKMKSGDYKWFRDVGRITEMDKEAKYQKITGIVIDIDKRKKAEIQLRDALDRSNFYKDLLAHDMANILNIIKSSMRLREMWKNEPDQSDKREELKENIYQQLERGGTLISNVRKISNLEQGKNQLKHVDVITILENSIEQTYSRFREGVLKINYDFPDGPIKILGGDLLLDAFENILLNGALHNEHKVKKLWIELSNIRKKEKEFLKIEFKDNGIGISDERKKNLFEKSYQKEESSVGMGIGLSLVKKIIKEYGGNIWVKNRVEDDYRQGSNFVVLLRHP